MLRDNTQHSIEYFVRNLGDETVQELIGETYNVYGMYSNRMDRLLESEL